MRKTIMSLSLAAALASTNVMADVDTLNAVKKALPAGVALSSAAATSLENAATEQEIADAVAAIVASLGDNATAITNVVKAAISENSTMATAIAKAAASQAPSQASTIRVAAQSVTPVSQHNAISQAVREGSTNPVNNTVNGGNPSVVVGGTDSTPNTGSGNGSGSNNASES